MEIFILMGVSDGFKKGGALRSQTELNRAVLLKLLPLMFERNKDM